MFAIGVTIGALVGIFIMCLLQINRENKECLHCGKGAARYCESCFQDLISENARLQAKIHLKKAKAFDHKIEKPKMIIYKDIDSVGNHIPRLD